MAYPFLQCYYITLKCMSETCSEQLRTGWNTHFRSAIMVHWKVQAKFAQSNCILDAISICAVLLLHKSVWAKLAQSNCILDAISICAVLAKLAQSKCILDEKSISAVLLCYTKVCERSLLTATAYWMEYPFLQCHCVTLKCKSAKNCNALMLH